MCFNVFFICKNQNQSCSSLVLNFIIPLTSYSTCQYSNWESFLDILSRVINRSLKRWSDTRSVSFFCIMWNCLYFLTKSQDLFCLSSSLHLLFLSLCHRWKLSWFDRIYFLQYQADFTRYPWFSRCLQIDFLMICFSTFPSK